MTQPLLTLSYALTPADALAYESLPREMIGWRKWALLIWLGASGGSVAFLPPDWVGPEWSWRFWLAALVLIAGGYGLAAAAVNPSARWRARRRAPPPAFAGVRPWGDHLAVDRDGHKSFAAYETIAAVTITDAYVFIDVPPEVILVPIRAFADRAEMVAFGEDVDRRSSESQP